MILNRTDRNGGPIKYIIMSLIFTIIFTSYFQSIQADVVCGSLLLLDQSL
jgi:hypothetical protein